MEPSTPTPAQARAWPLPARTSWLLQRYAVRPRKSLGQNFLINEGAARLLAQTATVPGWPVLEIGGGLGALSVPLAESGLPLTVVETDARLAEALSWLLGDLPQVRVVRGDALELDPADLVAQPAVGVGNLPYLSAGAILQRLWAPGSPCGELVVTVQREVANRLRAAPGTRAWGPLSVLAQAQMGDIRVVARLGPGSFRPAPGVESTALALRRPQPPAVRPEQEPGLEAALRAAFGQRRKTLANSLRAALQGDAARAEEVLRTAGLAGQRRGETLNLEELLALGQALQQEAAPQP